MKIEFSSWETTNSTLHRRRKRPPHEKNKTLEAKDLLAHSFVKSLRARTFKKARTQGLDDVIPLVVLTNATKVVVAGMLKGEFTVSQNRQYPCPPGLSFFPKDDNTPRVSAVFEKRNDLMYALRKQNNQIVCWPSMSDDPRDLVSRSLSRDRALSLEVMPGKFSLVFGTVQGVSTTGLFFASLDQGAREINLRKFDVPGLPKGKESKLQHVATVGYEKALDGPSVKSPVTRRRKATTMQESERRLSEGMIIVQALLNKSTLYVARHEIVAKDPSDVSSFEQVASVHKVPLNLGRQESIAVSFVGNVDDLVVLCCHTSSGSQFLLSVSAKTGKIVLGPFDVGAKPQRFSLVDSQSVIAQMDDGVGLIDLKSGATLQVISLPEDIRSEKWILLGMDQRRTRIFLLLEHEDGYSVVSANVSFEEDGGSSKCLAARLAQHVESRTESVYQGSLLRRQGLPNRETGDGGYSMVNTTRKGVELLNMACSMFESSRLNSNDDTLASIFGEALETMARAEGIVAQSTGHMVNPRQFDLNKKRGGMNGFIVSNGSSNTKITPVPSKGGKSGKQTFQGHASTTTSKALQIFQNLQKIDPSLVSFVGVSAIRVLLVERDIGTARNVARSILRKVIRSTKASARHLFDSSGGFSLPDVLKSLQKRDGEDKVSFSPVELLFDVCRHCKDTSERHMVVGAQYMLQRATAEDLCDYFERAQSENSSYRELCDTYKKLTNDAGTAQFDSEALEKCSSKLLLRGSEAYLMTILSYSECNEILLRRSVAENLSRGEVSLILRLVGNVTSAARKHNINVAAMKRSFLWTAALCERLNPLWPNDEMKLIKQLLASLSAEKDSTTALLNRVKDLVDISIEEATASSEDQTGLEQDESQLPPYQLERLIF